MSGVGRTVQVRGETHHYLEWGVASGHPILLMHGHPDVPTSFDGLAERLAAGGYRCIAPWMRGYAPAPCRGPYDVYQVAMDALGLMDALGIERAQTYGHDFGAPVASTIALLAERRVVAPVQASVPHVLSFFGNGLRSAAQRRRSWYIGYYQLPVVAERGVRRDDFRFVERLWRDWSPSLGVDEVRMAELKASIRVGYPALIEYYRGIVRPWRSHLGPMLSLSRASRRMPHRTLYLHGADDGCIGPEIARGQERFYPKGLETEIFEDVGHFIHMEASERVADAIDRFRRAG